MLTLFVFVLITNYIYSVNIKCYVCVGYTNTSFRNCSTVNVSTEIETSHSNKCITICNSRNGHVTRLSLTPEYEFLYSDCPYFFPWDHEQYCETCYWDYCNNKTYDVLLHQKPPWRADFLISQIDEGQKLEMISLAVLTLISCTLAYVMNCF